MTNPWGLTPGQVRALMAYIAHSSEKAAAYTLQCSDRTVHAHMNRARIRMRARNRVDAVLQFARWLWSQEVKT